MGWRRAWCSQKIIFKVRIIQNYRSRQALAGETILFLFLLYKPETRQRLAWYFWCVAWRYFHFVIFVLSRGFFRRLCFYVLLNACRSGVIGSRQAWAGEPITIILISDRQHIGGWPSVFWCLTRHLFLCLVCVLGLGGVFLSWNVIVIYNFVITVCYCNHNLLVIFVN